MEDIINFSWYVQCVPQVDAAVLTTLIPKLIDLLKSGVGLGTKVATAQLIISLVRQCMFDLTPFAGENSCRVCVWTLTRGRGGAFEHTFFFVCANPCRETADSITFWSL